MLVVRISRPGGEFPNQNSCVGEGLASWVQQNRSLEETDIVLWYQAVAYIEASAYIYQDGKLLMEVDHLQHVLGPYIQIKGANKEVTVAAGSALELDGSYTTKSYLQIVLEKLPASERNSSGINAQQAARLQELVENIQSQGSSSSSESSPSREVISPIEGAIEDMQSRIKRLERWQAINTVL
ncbi:unnamed protein product [Lactuca virosa]|uniref:Uncharacterized protein n=1 Tax=Lactuca virosa TaxID=75947 RepID=A0AAU9PMS7_9ASTR|nr:unnamed protein product [Lactuca virosa]